MSCHSFIDKMIFHYTEQDMKKINISLLLLALFSLSILSCERNKIPEDIINRSDSLRTQIESTTFTYIGVYDNSGITQQDSYKCYAKRGKDNEDEGILMLRVEGTDGRVVTYDGDTFRSINPEKKEVFVVTRKYNPAKFVRRYMRMINMVMAKQSDENDDKANDDVVTTFDGTARVDGILCDIISKSGPAFDDNSKFYSLSYLGIEDGIARKESFTLFANGLKIQYDKSIVTDIKTNIELPDSLFAASVPKGYKLDKYSVGKSSGRGESPQLLAIGELAPNWRLAGGNGDSVSLSDMLGRPVVLDFWGTWCVWCVVAMPKINNIYEKYNRFGINVIGISCREPEEADPSKFMADRGIKYKALLNGDSVAKSYNVSGFPTLYVIGSDGRIIFSEAGYRDDIDSVLSAIIEADSAVAVQLDTIPSSAGTMQ